MRKFIRRPLLPFIFVLTLLLPYAYAISPDLSEYSRLFQDSRVSLIDYTPIADTLNYLGLIKGRDNSGSNYELDSQLTRIEALVTVIRLCGMEDAALSENRSSSFSDVPLWASAYAGYAQYHGIVLGIGNGLLGSDDFVTAQQYMTMLLRVLGFSDSNADFEYAQVLTFAFDYGLIDYRDYLFYSDSESFLRNDMMLFMFNTLTASVRYSKVPLIWELTENGVISADTAFGSLLSAGETEAEIKRALSNGYSELWLQSLNRLIDNNSNIPPSFKSVFKSCIYDWLKEGGFEAHISELEQKITGLTVEITNKSHDPAFSENSVLAYFLQPDKIVIRDDLDFATSLSTISHEFRHAMTGNCSIPVLEEGITEFWNQEVNNGDHGYPYYYVNISKFFTHIIGAQAINKADLLGSYEFLFYELERNSGIRIEKNRLYDSLSRLCYTISETETLTNLNSQLLEILEGYYNTNMPALIEESPDGKHFTDVLISAAQLLYYPSTVVLYMDSDRVFATPSSFFPNEFERFADSILRRYAKETDTAVSPLLEYYRQNKDKRYCLKYLGSDSGTVYTKAGTGYNVYYSHNGREFSKSFGTLELAEEFKNHVEFIKMVKIDGAFIPKYY